MDAWKVGSKHAEVINNDTINICMVATFRDEYCGEHYELE